MWDQGQVRGGVQVPKLLPLLLLTSQQLQAGLPQVLCRAWGAIQNPRAHSPQCPWCLTLQNPHGDAKVPQALLQPHNVVLQLPEGGRDLLSAPSCDSGACPWRFRVPKLHPHPLLTPPDQLSFLTDLSIYLRLKCITGTAPPLATRQGRRRQEQPRAEFQTMPSPSREFGSSGVSLL